MRTIDRNSFSLLVFHVLLITTAFSMGANAVHIDIYNDFGQGVTLTIHCRYNGADLGARTLPYPKAVGFDIDEKARGAKLSCSFQWPGASHSYNVYIAGWDRCHPCKWMARKSGPCLEATLFGDGGIDEQCHNWD
ncbi:hypothetical protein CJ030_MR1G019990 [Morella rubra]|uniref:S-protein homolog n=1 Tax=Morella rubra TaxID=262757 RepID=A0A6A1WY35_9ROSI|nr:hypothetical protein CJ030_MR1G019990 [Morella rubra]